MCTTNALRKNVTGEGGNPMETVKDFRDLANHLLFLFIRECLRQGP